MTGGEITDTELMRRAAQGQASAFDALLRRHQRVVFRFLFRLTGDCELAEDLTQECFLRVWRARASYLPTAKFPTYLLAIARHLVLDSAKSRPPAFPLRPSDAADPSPLPPAVAEARALSRVLDCELRRLPDVLREAVVLRDIENLPYADIAAVVGCPVGTVKSRLAAGRARLQKVAKEWLEEE